jgi:hypothetical protein
MKKMAEDHGSMKSWHETMAKAAATQMQDHMKAASWHDSQAAMIKGMINEIPLDPETKPSASIPTGSYAPTPSASTPSSPMTSPQNVSLDPDTVKKSDLIAILSDYQKEFGSFDMSVEDIASFLLAK